MPVPTERKLLIVDGHAYAYRAFHAIRHLNASSGRPTNAIYGFIKMLGKMQHLLRPTHQAVWWDGGLAEDRLAALPEYKCQRPPMPDDLEQQIPEIQAFLQASRIASFCEPRCEADDAIAVLARQAAREGCFVVIASSDKDFMQLVGPRIGLFNSSDKSETVWDADKVRAKTGVAPDQIVDWLSLIGDAVDNIPGVTGVGSKTAAQLLNQFGTLEALAGRLNELKSERLRLNLAAAQVNLKRNQQLIRLKEDIELPCALTELETRLADHAQLRPLYERWEFKTLLSQLDDTPLLL